MSQGGVLSESNICPPIVAQYALEKYRLPKRWGGKKGLDDSEDLSWRESPIDGWYDDVFFWR